MISNMSPAFVMRQLTATGVALVIFAASGGGFSFAGQPQLNGSVKSLLQPIPGMKKTSPYYYVWHWEWLNEAWNGNDVPFAAARRQIDLALTLSSADHVIKPLTASANANPDNALAVFKNAYARYTASLDSKNTQDMVNALLEGISNALAQPTSPHSYNYDRLRLLILSSMPFPDYIPLATRIYNHCPDDDQNVCLYYSILRSGNETDILRAKTIAEHLCDRYPNQADRYAGLAAVYRRLWFATHDNANALKCIANYQKFLQLAAPDDGFRSEAVLLINDMKRHANLQ